MFTDFYQNLFSSNTDVSDWFQNDISFPPIDKFKIYVQNSKVSDVEIKDALFDMSPWKAPGPNWPSPDL